ncbi:hypothetical protein CEB3_c35180 [Peptococcaceae bacterium CEB3]|nr:hypothetical protein CEB3_c35180 [Peptococcaceae bacterium CEB3]
MWIARGKFPTEYVFYFTGRDGFTKVPLVLWDAGGGLEVIEKLWEKITRGESISISEIVSFNVGEDTMNVREFRKKVEKMNAG